MNVKTLIEELQKYPPEMEVYTHYYEAPSWNEYLCGYDPEIEGCQEVMSVDHVTSMVSHGGNDKEAIMLNL